MPRLERFACQMSADSWFQQMNFHLDHTGPAKWAAAHLCLGAVQ